jgi:hypothetical protein
MGLQQDDVPLLDKPIDLMSDLCAQGEEFSVLLHAFRPPLDEESFGVRTRQDCNYCG